MDSAGGFGGWIRRVDSAGGFGTLDGWALRRVRVITVSDCCQYGQDDRLQHVNKARRSDALLAAASG
ncbi:hypothetical protein DIE15_05145 [Burkholderia sp. Bp9031]|nr:hypothetical protein DIE15_05145 [Burkholderia sp. Bp9031]